MGLRRSGKRIHRDQRGAQLVEFAILAPLLFLLLFGIMEAAWTFSDVLDVRHAAREAARVAAVDSGEPGQVACARMKAGLQQSATVDVSPSSPALGDNVTVTISTVHSSLTGLVPFFDGITLTESVTIRYERSAGPSWSGTYPGYTCP